MKKKILIALLSITLIGLIIGTMYIIDRKKKVNLSENNPQIDNIVLNDDYKIRLVSYDVKCREINEDLKELQKLKYPSEINLSRAMGLYIKSDIEQNSYDKLHDINLFFEGKDKSFSITMSMREEPLTDYKDFNNKNNYKQSLIDGNEVVILHNNNDSVNQKQYYVCIFKYNDVYYVIETTNFSQEEVVTLVKSIFECDMKTMINKQANNN